MDSAETTIQVETIFYPIACKSHQKSGSVLTCLLTRSELDDGMGCSCCDDMAKDEVHMNETPVLIPMLMSP